MRAFGNMLIGIFLTVMSTAAVAIDEYRLDDGVKELGIGVQSTGSNSIAWLNRFVVQPGYTTITAVRIAFGGSLAQTNIGNGQPLVAYLWSDPNQDGDPDDAFVIASAVGVVQGTGTNSLTAYSFSPPYPVLQAGTTFFAGAIVTYSGQVLVGSLDRDGTDDVVPYPSALHSFVASSDNGTPVDPNALALAQGPVDSVSNVIFAGTDDATWMIRLNAPPPNTPLLDINPNPLDFNVVPVGTTFGPLLVLLTNVGTANLDIGAIGSVALPFFMPPPGSGICPAPPFSLAPGFQCALHYSFAPTTPGLAAAAVAIDSNAPSSPDTLSLQGFGDGPQPVVSPSSLDFGEVDVDAVSATLDMSLGNSGTSSWIINAIQVSDPSLPPSPFQESTGTCGSFPITLAPSATCNLSFRFAPIRFGPDPRDYELVDNSFSGATGFMLQGIGTLFGHGFEDP